MSSQNKLSFWQRIKNLLLANDKSSNSDVRENKASAQPDNDQAILAPAPVEGQATSAQSENQTDASANQSAQNQYQHHPKTEPHGADRSKAQADTDVRHKHPEPSSSDRTANQSLDKHSEYHSGERKQSKFITLSNLDEADSMKQRSRAYHTSDKPITDAILDFLEASDLSYYYHEPEHSPDNSRAADNNSSDASQAPADTKSAPDSETAANSTESAVQPPHKNKVHHISMAMRYYSENSANEQAYMDDSLDDMASSHTDDLEWGCVIRIHEHTQLVAMYGVLPFQLPPSHLKAGITLATQLNYDMMLGGVEIDIRDGEIRFKNALDMEPIINASGGIVPPTVISYLLKGIMAMTSSFSPLFRDLLNSDPESFELEHILEERHKAKMDNTFFLATTTPQ